MRKFEMRYHSTLGEETSRCMYSFLRTSRSFDCIIQSPAPLIHPLHVKYEAIHTSAMLPQIVRSECGEQNSVTSFGRVNLE